MSTSLSSSQLGLCSYPTCNYPVFPSDEAAGADGYIGEFECLDNGLGYVRPDVDVSCLGQHSACLRCSFYVMHTTVQGREDPWLGRVKVFGRF